MILTEEQRAAIHAVSGLLTAIGCPQCHSYLQKNYTHHIEVLRAMTDSSEQFSDASKMIGFDLERARGLRDFLQDDCAEVGDVWAEMIAEIERLLDEKAFLEKVIHKKNIRLNELEDELVKERTGAIRCESYNHCEGMYEIDLPNAIIRAQTELQAEGKIGPDAAPRSWQITDERVEALKVATGEMDLSENIFYLNSLKTMLTEAGQE